MAILQKKSATEEVSAASKASGYSKSDSAEYLVPEFSKLLIITHNHPAHIQGGAEVCAYELYKEFRDKNICEVRFLAGDHPLEKADVNARDQIIRAFDIDSREYILPNTDFSYFTQVRKDASVLTKSFVEFLSEYKPDVVHFHHTLKIGIEAIKIVKRVLPKARIIYTLHDFIPICNREGQMVKTDGSLCNTAGAEACHRCFPDISPQQFKMRELFIKTHFDLVDEFIAPSQFLARRYAAWGLPEESIHVIKNGRIWQKQAGKRQIKQGDKHNRFAFFGNITAYKGVDVLLSAVKILMDCGVHDFSVSIHGSFPITENDFSREIRASIVKLEPQVRFFGSYPNDELSERMEPVDYVIVPSIWWENAPLVISEAFHNSRPVICSNIGGMAEKVKDGVDGLHFRRGDANHLASVMRHAMQESGLWERLSERTGEEFSMTSCVNSHLELYGCRQKA
jgi:glycosyltransferase involved in cell wall biosynthesis